MFEIREIPDVVIEIIQILEIREIREIRDLLEVLDTSTGICIGIQILDASIRPNWKAGGLFVLPSGQQRPRAALGSRGQALEVPAVQPP